MSSLTLPEQLFLRRWKSIDFTGWNEAEVREGFIIDLLHTLGYRKGTTYDLEMEKPLKLAKPYHRIGRKKVDIDYAPSVRKRYFWIVEAKPGKAIDMKHGDLLQVHLYAVHPEVQARLIVLINGWQVRVYDALTLTSFDEPLLVVNQGENEETFIELREMIGASRMLQFQRKRLLDIVRDTLASEVDVDVSSGLAEELAKLAYHGKKVVEENAKQLWMSSWKKRLDDEGAELKTDSLEVLFVKMDLPEDGRPAPAREFVRRVLAGNAQERARLVDRLAMHYRARPHGIFRVLALHALVELVESGVVVARSSYVTSITDSINELALANIDYWSSNALANALCHLDNVTMRVSMKFCLRVGQPIFEQILTAWKASLVAEEKVRQRASLDALVASTAAHLQEIFWRWYCGEGSGAAIWEGIWNLHAIEADLEKLPPIATNGESLDFYSFAFIGTSHDQLRNGTWNVLKRKADLLASEGIDARVLEFAAQSHEAVRAELPQEKRCPSNWKPTRTIADVNDVFTEAVAFRIVATLGQQIRSEPPKGVSRYRCE